ncbi:hypothetical protein ND856_02495 [Leptospira bandrabouensis]|uniref:hypothetical protein n=1 Tax=Leptospira bandrabouensis TaxID=2484903 RepID=UPI00223CA544|nr:hypothetical protein [Leptospira bandrabouensis]MCW7457583.1 hypothetical protein [Leptospira bandrabouensis]MCW7476141.1 hypothetical protein [Leptospira bandrabouensis]MCW7483823.1 hypothetical protein [Leptospira bandrabouensis]
MKKIINKGLVLALIAMMGLASVDCQKKKDDNTLLLAALAFLLNQPEYTIILTGTLKTSGGSEIKDGKVVVEDGENPILSSGQTNLSDFTSCQTNSYAVGAAAPANTVDGEFTLSFRTTTVNGALKFSASESTGADNTSNCSSVVANLAASTFTNSLGNGTLNLNIDLNDRTNTSNVSVTASGFIATIKAVKVFVKGEYPIVNPTIGENLCDGRRLAGGPTIKSGSISGSETWSGGILLQGTVFVESGATLTVSPGTAIFGQRGSSIFFKQGSKLIANGTAADPICWSSASALGSRFPGDWGGIVVIGTSGASRSSNTEGTTPQGYGGALGSDVENLNMSYNIVEFGGNEVAPGDELNNLSIYSSKSVLNHVQVHRGLDDGVEAWGGSGTWSNMLATGGLDDDFDLDESFTGTLTNLIGHKYPSSCGGSFSTDPHGFEMDGIDSTSGGGGTCAGSLSRCTNPTITNVTLVGAGISGGQGMRLREGFAGTINKAIIYGFADAAAVSTSTTGTFPAVTATISNLAYETGKTTAITPTGSTTISATPISSVGSTTECGFGETKPDYRTIGSLSGTYVGGATSEWYKDWTVYRAR